MKERDVIIGHPLGLHARAAARLVQLSANYRATIVLFRDDSVKPAEADARSILSILLLAAAHGSKLRVRADGADEDEALDRICEYLAG
jgi:phosphocarrier protein HPr